MVGPSATNDEHRLAAVDRGEIARRSRMLRASSRRLLIEAQLINVESKRMLLSNAERRFRATRPTEVDRLVRTLRGELEHAEAMYIADLADAGAVSRSEKLRKLYAKLASRGSAAVDFMSRIAPHLSPPSRFDNAVRVQALEELIDRWREIEGVPTESSRSSAT